MFDYKRLAKIFEDIVEGTTYYETRAALALKNDLFTILENETRQLLFLIGEPGCGKSVFLNNLQNMVRNRYKVIKFDTPFFEPRDFIASLLRRQNQEEHYDSFELMIAKVMELYSQQNIIIAIDEAQLLSKEMIELLRILADSKVFWFILAMHKHESERILQEPQFASRPHRVLELGKLEENEVREYISKELIKEGQYIFQEEFSKELCADIFRFTHGNFRDTKKLLYRLFILMEEAFKLGKRGYEKPNRCLVTMAAIDGGLLRV